MQSLSVRVGHSSGLENGVVVVCVCVCVCVCVNVCVCCVCVHASSCV